MSKSEFDFPKEPSPVGGTPTGEEGERSDQMDAPGASGNSAILDVTVPTDTTGYVVSFSEGCCASDLLWPVSGSLQVVARVFARLSLPLVVLPSSGSDHDARSLHDAGLGFTFSVAQLNPSEYWRTLTILRAELSGFSVLHRLAGRFEVLPLPRAGAFSLTFDRRLR